MAVLMAHGTVNLAEEKTNWFVSFERIQVAPVERSNTTQLVDAGTIDTDDFASKREVYYTSKGSSKRSVAGDSGQAVWGPAGFKDQTESDTIMDDIEAMFSLSGISREELRFVPDEHGGAVAGQLIVLDPDLETGAVERIDCTRFGSGAYSIPSSVEQLSFETKAKFILAIETGGVFQRLQSHKFWQTAKG